MSRVVLISEAIDTQFNSYFIIINNDNKLKSIIKAL